MQRLHDAAFVSVGRGCGFAALAIGTFMFGLSSDMAQSTQAGGILGLLVCFFLIFRAARAHVLPYRRTEVWMMLEPDDRPPEALAQRLVASALQSSYLRFALQYALGSAALLFASILLRILRAGA